MFLFWGIYQPAISFTKKEVFIFYVKNICSVDVFMHDPHNFVLNSISRDIV